MRRNARYLMLFATLLAASAIAAPPHQHGVAALDVLVDDTTLRLTLQSPLDDLLGFEHVPRDEKQRRTLAEAEAKLRDALTLFVPVSARACTLVGSELRHPWTLTGSTTNQTGRHDDHAELVADWVFTCTGSDALRRIDVRLFAAFPGMKRIKARVVSPHGQRGATLTPGNRLLVW